MQYKRTALGLAIEKGHLSTVELLLDRGATVVDISDGDDDDPPSHTPLTLAAAKGKVHIARRMLERGASVHTKGQVSLIWGLHCAKAEPSHSAVCLLTVAALHCPTIACVPTLRGSQSESPLMHAAGGGCKELLGMLVDAGASIEETNDVRMRSRGKTLAWASRQIETSVMHFLPI